MSSSHLVFLARHASHALGKYQHDGAENKLAAGTHLTRNKCALSLSRSEVSLMRVLPGQDRIVPFIAHVECAVVKTP